MKKAIKVNSKEDSEIKKRVVDYLKSLVGAIEQGGRVLESSSEIEFPIDELVHTPLTGVIIRRPSGTTIVSFSIRFETNGAPGVKKSTSRKRGGK